MTRRLVRRPKWFPREKAAEPAGHGEPQRPVSAISSLAATDSGLLIVKLSIVTDRWRPIADSKERGRVQHTFHDYYIEVVDVATWSVIASHGPLSTEELSQGVPQDFFLGSKAGYINNVSDLGFNRHRIVEMRLTPLRQIAVPRRQRAIAIGDGR